MRRTLIVLSWLAMMLVPAVAQAVVVERVVAVVGERAILLTDVRKRARPYLARLYGALPAGPQRAGAESKIMKDMLERMVDEELETIAAARQNVRVNAEEVDQALRRVAKAAGMPLSELYRDVESNTGLSQIEYRQEIRRQVLEGKLLQRFAQNQRVTKGELDRMFDRVKKQERMILLYQPSWIVLRLGKNAKPELVESRMAQAREIVARARAGEDFASLVEEHSEDPSTVAEGGDLGIRVPSQSPRAQEGQYKLLSIELEEVALELEQGEVADPFVFKDEAIVILTVTRRQPTRYISLDAVRLEMAERVRAEKLQKVKEKWLEDLRRRTHVDVRM